MALDTIDLPTWILAAGALGTASYGFVDVFKFFSFISAIGYGHIKKGLDGLNPALEEAYGKNYQALLKAHYQTGKSKGDLPVLLRQGVRIGLKKQTAKGLADFLNVASTEQLENIAEKVAKGTGLIDTEKAVLARFEVALDARIGSAIAMAEQDNANSMRMLAAITAVVLSLIAGYNMALPGEGYVLKSLIAGLAAVPLAPVAKDVATALQTYTKTLKGKK